MLYSVYYVRKLLMCWLRRLAIILTLPRTVVSISTTYCNIRKHTRYTHSSYAPQTETVYLRKQHLRIRICEGDAMRMEVKCSLFFNLKFKV